MHINILWYTRANTLPPPFYATLSLKVSRGIHLNIDSLASPLFARVYGLRDYLASSSITYLPMHCLGLNAAMYAEKMHKNLTFGTRLEAIKNWTVERPGKFQNMRLVHT